MSKKVVPKKIDGYSVDHLLRTAKDVVEKKTKHSVVLDREAEARIPKFDIRELKIGRVLGRGGFCVVSDIANIKLMKRDDEDQNGMNGIHDVDDEHHMHNIVQDRHFMENYCIRSGKDTRYAIKQVQESSYKDHQTFINGVVDLAVEARFLSVIRHPNIIKMRAMEQGVPYSPDFFVILDRLYDIMSNRLTKWKKNQFIGMKKLMDRGGKKELAFFVERLTVAYDLACALKYLHDLNIVYRDLKPDNIGFDVRGDVKIFDFGLAKEIDPKAVNDQGTYKLTGDTGSPRYMAPEVALEKPYNENVDVYSFSILLWQILKLEVPFEGYTLGMFQKKVVNGGARPKPDEKWPKELADTLRRGWGDLNERPSMEVVCCVLRDEISRNSDEEIDEIMDASRKSEMSLRRGGC